MISVHQIQNIFLKGLIFLLLLSLAITACKTNVTKTGTTTGQADQQKAEKISDPIELSLDKLSYSKSDTIKISVENKTDSDIVIGLRCGIYLEMFYQKGDDGHWSENKQMWYSSLRCPTKIYTLKPLEKYDFLVPSDKFDSTGRFRLSFSSTVASENTYHTITSAPFEIKER